MKLAQIQEEKSISFTSKINCFDVTEEGIAFGTHDQKLFHCQNDVWKSRNLPEPPTVVAITEDANEVAFALKSGKVGINSAAHVEKKFQILQAFNSQVRVTAMHFGDRKNLFIGTENGLVSVFNCNDFTLSRILDLGESIVQIQMTLPNILVSSEKVSIICNTETKTFKEVGSKARQGSYGGTIMNNEEIICSRPGFRIWKANMEGKVTETLQFKKSLHEEKLLKRSRKQHFGFSKIFKLTKGFIMTFDPSGVYFINVNDISLLEHVPIELHILDAKAVNNVIWILCENGILKKYSRQDNQTTNNEKTSKPEREMDNHNHHGNHFHVGCKIIDDQADCFRTFSRRPMMPIMFSPLIEQTSPTSQATISSSNSKSVENITDFQASRETVNVEDWKNASVVITERIIFKTKELLRKNTEILQDNLDKECIQGLDEMAAIGEFLLSCDSATENENFLHKTLQFRDIFLEIRLHLQRNFERFENLKTQKLISINETLAHLIYLEQFIFVTDQQSAMETTDFTKHFFSDECYQMDLKTVTFLDSFKEILMPNVLISKLTDGSSFNTWMYLMKRNSNLATLTFPNIDQKISICLKHCGTRYDKICCCHWLLKFNDEMGKSALEKCSEDLHLQDLVFFYLIMLQEEGFFGKTDAFAECELDKDYCSMTDAWFLDIVSKKSLEPETLKYLQKFHPIKNILIEKFKLLDSDHKNYEIISHFIASLLQTPEEKLHLFKSVQFWSGYKMTLNDLGKESLWEELEDIFDLNDATLLSKLQLLENLEDCKRVFESRSNHQAVLLSWDDIGMEILERQGIEKAWKILLSNSKIFPPKSFTPKFYRTLISLGIKS